MEITNGIPRASFSARDFSSILTELQAYLTITRPDLVTDFNEASLGQALLEMIAIVGELTSFGLDQAALQFFLSTATQISSGMRWAQSVGYTPRAASGSTVSVIGYMPAPVLGSGGTIPAGSSFSGPNDTSFYTSTDISIPASTTPITITLTEGLPRSDTFAPATLPRYFVTTSQGNVAQSSWSVVINSVAWTQIADVSLETSATNTYQISFDAEGHLIVQFGDGVAGAIPSSTITINYAITSGSTGNVPALGLSGVLQINVTGGGTAAATFTNPAASSGGTDQETLAELQRNIPAFIRNGGKLTTLQDYNDFPNTINGVALSFADLSFASNNGNAVQVSIWASTVVNFTSESNVGMQVVPYVAYSDGSALVATVKAALIPITDVSVLPLVQAPGLAFVDLYLSPLVYDSSFDPNAIQFNVTQAIVNAFENGDGFSVKLGDLYSALNSVGGVKFTTLSRYVVEFMAKAAATGTVVFSGNIQPADGDLVVINDSVTTTTFEFDSNNSINNGNVRVAMGPSAQDTMTEFVIVLIQQNLNVTGYKTTDANPTCNITAKIGGAAFNNAITKTGSVITVTGLSGGSDGLSSVIQDHRAILNPPPGNDPWPSGTYTPGTPYTGSSPWADGGQPPYLPITDIPRTAPSFSQNYYDTAYISSNQIVYPSSVAAGGAPAAMVLRRIWMLLQAG